MHSGSFFAMRFSENQLVRFIVFISGAAIMGIEIMASRLLAPYYGDTVYVWGSLIAVIMTALAIGYRRGGGKADIYASLYGLTNILLVAGFFVVLIPVSAPFVLEVVSELGLPSIYEPLLPAIILLSVPTMYLGMVSPYALRLVAENLDNLGGVSGNLSSLNTVGSIVGTFFTVFGLVPNFGTREILTAIGVTLVLISVLEKGRVYFLSVSLLLVIIIVPSNVLFGPVRVIGGGSHIFITETPYSSLTVVDNHFSGTRTLFLNNMAHSAMYVNGSVDSVYDYTDYFNLGFGYNPNISRVLFIGGGGFSGPRQFLVKYPDIKIDVVEIDPVVVDVAHRFFLVPKNDPMLDIYVMDGRSFLEDSGVYDLIVLDAYSKTYVPFHLMTDEFFQLMDEHLDENGVLIANVIGGLVGDTSRLLWSQVVTVEKSFPCVDLYSTRHVPASVVQNVCLIAGENNLSRVEVADNLLDMGLSRCITYLDNKYTGEKVPDAIILRDNYAPVEDMLNPVTLSNYVLEDDSGQVNLLRPILITGLWLFCLVGVYIISSRKPEL